MTIHIVDIEHVLHVSPANPEPHIVDTRRTLVHTIDGGPCRTPATIQCGTATVTIPCRRHLPADQQCGACRTIITERTITIRHLDQVTD